MKCYVSTDPAEKRKSRRDQLTRKIQETENLGKALRDKQREVKETHSDALKQVKMWEDLRRQLEVKRQCFEAGQQRKMKDQADEKAAATINRLVIS